jgi:mono/diheme cytochrome c family protein
MKVELTPWRVLSALVIVAGVAMCAHDEWRQHSASGATPAARAGGLPRRPRLEPGLGREQAHAALAADAERREQRFRDAADPGRSWRATRVEASALAAMRPEEIYAVGAQLFQHRFTRREGFGGKDRERLSRVHLGARGGPDAYACADCHRRGGPAGGGDSSDNAYLEGDGDRPDSAFERNPIALHGAGILELLAREMSDELARQARQAMRDAKQRGEAVRVELSAKGVSFGAIRVAADGVVDPSELAGVARDLRVRPFGWKGHAESLADVVEDELAIHHGMQSARLAAGGARARVGPFAPPDPDGDGVVDEISAGQLGALTLFIAMQEIPTVDLPARSEQLALWPIGRQRFEEIGCARCHVPSLPLESAVYTLPPLAEGAPPVRVDLAQHGAEPRLTRGADGRYQVPLFSDLKRHAVGPELREGRSYRSVLGSHFLTPPLWGLARSRPYLHDGRAAGLEEAILAHDGEALEARDAYAALDEEARAPLRIFLVALTRAPRISSP